jgi:hypothetical protein
MDCSLLAYFAAGAATGAGIVLIAVYFLQDR